MQSHQLNAQSPIPPQNQQPEYSTKSCKDLRYIAQQKFLLKLPKNPLRKQAQMNVHKESKFNPEKSSIRNFDNPMKSVIFQAPEPKKRYYKEATYANLANSTFNKPNNVHQTLSKPQKPSKTQKPYKFNNPIVTPRGQEKHNSTFTKAWTEQRKYRDNGQKCEEALHWKVDKQQSLNNSMLRYNSHASISYVKSIFN